MGCENCHETCGGEGNTLLLTPEELELLRRFAQTPFLPAAAMFDRKTPVYWESPKEAPPTYSAAILGLTEKGLIRLDYDIPLKNFDYAGYESYPLHGSMALTGRGQDILEQVEIQGIEE
ncbi:hypothetical protein [uncultured Oscillibacter sp.]|uniref:hypothetical protein n=1 Tax=uncultured Oscillibacter sp. TaxID=876091 RepID=UPI0025DC3BE8|nr:hypothetical protein [uncultured Oscillibacter sp.]